MGGVHTADSPTFLSHQGWQAYCEWLENEKVAGLNLIFRENLVAQTSQRKLVYDTLVINIRTADDVKMTSQAYEISNYANKLEPILSKFLEFSYFTKYFYFTNFQIFSTTSKDTNCITPFKGR